MKKTKWNKRQSGIKRVECFVLAAALMLSTMFGVLPSGSAPSAGLIDAYAGEANTPRADEYQISQFESPADPFSYNSFAEMYSEGLLMNNFSADDNVDYFVDENGLRLTTKNEALSSRHITIRKLYDFGTIPDEGEDGIRVNRVMINALAKYMTNTTIRLYLDEEKNPLVEKKIKRQTEEDDWDLNSPVFAEVPDSIYGQHYITLEISDITTSSDKKSSILLRGIKFYKESVPTVYINIDEDLVRIDEMNGDEDHKTNCYGDMTVKVPDGYQSAYGDATTCAETNGTYKLEYIRGRGNSTWDADKKPYKIKLEKKADLFGMGENKHWALIANYYDNSLIRNRITYYLGEALGFEYSPRLVPVDVVMNGNYLGSYYLSEVVKISENRVNIPNMEDLKEKDVKKDPDWMTGGYLLGVSPYGTEDGYIFETPYGVRIVLDSPEEMPKLEGIKDPTTGEVIDYLGIANDYIENYIDTMEAALFADDMCDEDGNSYRDYVDLDSAAKYFLLQEFSNNGDAYITASTKLYKKKNGKLYFGPLWDFDYVAWGSWDYGVEQWTAEDRGAAFPWLERMKNDPAFVEKVRTEWAILKTELNKLIAKDGLIDQYKAELENAAENNFDIPGAASVPLGIVNGEEEDQPVVQPVEVIEEQSEDPSGERPADPSSGQPVDPSGAQEEVEPSDDTPDVIICENYADEIDRLKDWIGLRLTWFDEYMKSFDKDVALSTVSFYDGDELIDSYIAPKDCITRLPEAPEHEGYYFTGWYGMAPVDHSGEEEGGWSDYSGGEYEGGGYSEQISANGDGSVQDSGTVIQESEPEPDPDPEMFEATARI